MKKIMCLFLTLILFLAFSAVAFGLEIEAEEKEAVKDDVINAIGAKEVSNGLTISGGIASCQYTVKLNYGYKADVTTILQQYTGSVWDEFESWHHDKCSGVSITKNKAVTRGYKYRLKTYVNVYDSNGNYVEPVTKISPSVSYY
ncbi:MAG: hypothetical protein ACOX7J_04505 [Bacillota bacterium]